MPRPPATRTETTPGVKPRDPSKAASHRVECMLTDAEFARYVALHGDVPRAATVRAILLRER
jgi:hypothetical protein